MKDELHVLGGKFDLMSFKSLRRGALKRLWKKTKVLAPESILSALLSADSLKAARRVLRKNTDVLVDLGDLVDGFSRLLNEAAATTLAGMQLGLPERRKPGRRPAAERAPAREAVHDESPVSKCEICGREFRSKKGLRLHSAIQHKEQQEPTGGIDGEARAPKPLGGLPRPGGVEGRSW
ncbi:MAG TPA: C2H2-type zinc finger protein [Phycisphaerae bacterium]|nr:C2H2-type zinc finger protein [Phycisphaerae bacterium]